MWNKTSFQKMSDHVTYVKAAELLYTVKLDQLGVFKIKIFFFFDFFKQIDHFLKTFIYTK